MLWKDDHCFVYVVVTDKLSIVDSYLFFFSSRRRHTRSLRDWSSDVCSSDLDAVSGVQVQTEKVWKFANEYGVPRVVVINRLDRERADFFRTLEALQKRLKGRLAPFQIPVGSEAGFTGVVDLIAMKALITGDGKVKETEIPAEVAETANSYREKLAEAAAETDDE